MQLDRNSIRRAGPLGPFLAFLAIIAAARPVCAGPETPPNPRCAWIAASDEPVLALAEARMLAESHALWLERAEIDRLLAERRLQDAFGAEAVTERIGLGRVLKADILVLARAGGPTEQPFAELVLAETAGGMRILSRPVPLTDNTEADAARLCELVGAGLNKFGQTIREVYAVSPFLCQDLGYDHDHLRSAYARLFEETLLAQPGVLVVELKEAEALAREYAISDPAARPIRRLPIYVLGEFRHEGRGESLRVEIAVKTRRGEQLLDESSRLVSPADVPDLFREISDQWRKGRGDAIVEPDTALEVRTLANRVEELSRLGQWRDVLDLCEATLLLAPDRLDLRYRAIRAARLLLDKPQMDSRTRISLGSRALEHAEIVVGAGIPEPALFAQAFYGGKTPPTHPAHLPWGLRDWERVPEEYVRPLMNLEISERQVSRQLADRFAELENWFMWEQCLGHATDWRLPRERYADRAAAVLQHQHKLPEKTIKNVCRSGRLSVERDQILATLAESPHAGPAVRAAVRKLLDETDRYKRSFPGLPPAEPVSSNPPAMPADADGRTPLTFRPIELKCPSLFLPRMEELQPDFWQPLPGGVDLLAQSPYRVLLLKQHGPVKPIGLTSRSGVSRRISYPSFDGKYVWIAANDAVFVLDPASEKVWSIETGDRLPDLTMDPSQKTSSMLRLRVLGITPGKAVAVGFNGRTWYAMIHFNPQGENKIDILYEARESPDHRDTQGACNYSSPQAAFIPRHMRLLTAENPAAGAPRSILVARQGTCSHFWAHPAILDPDAKTVRISTESFQLFPNQYFFHQREDRKCDLATREFPDGALRTILPDIAPGRVVVHGDELHVANRQWWKGSLSAKSLQSCGPVPWKYTDLSGTDPSKSDSFEIRFAGYSGHYGPCVLLRHPKRGTRILQVLFDGSGLPYEKAIAVPDVPEPLQPEQPPQPAAILPCYRPPEHPEILWEGGSRDCRDLVFTPDEKHILTARRTPGQGLRLWEATSGRLVADLLEGEPCVSQIVISPSGKYFAAATDDGQVILWSTSQWAPLCHLEWQRERIRCLAFSWDERRIAVNRELLGTRIFDVDTGRELVQVADKKCFTRWIGFTPDNTRLITSYQGGNVNYWSSHDGSFLSSVKSIIWIGGFTSDRKLLGIANNLEHSLAVWDTEAESLQQLPFQAPFVPHALSQDGRRMVLSRRLDTGLQPGVEIHRAWVWDFPEAKEVFAYSGPLAFKQFRFSPDGNVLFVLGEPKPPWRLDVGGGQTLSHYGGQN